MLATPTLPPSVRTILLEYIEEKAAGVYGHSKLRRKQFAARLSEARRRPGGPRSLNGSHLDGERSKSIWRIEGGCTLSKGAIEAEHRVMTKLDAVKMTVHQNNIERYRRLLRTKLTDLEGQYVERRLAEERQALSLLIARRRPIPKESAKPSVLDRTDISALPRDATIGL
jgi:hypothetical protein